MKKINKLTPFILPCVFVSTLAPILTSCNQNQGSTLSASINLEYFVGEQIKKEDFVVTLTKKDGSKQQVTDWTCETQLPYTFVDTQPHEFVIKYQNLVTKVTKTAQEHTPKIKVTFTTDGNGTLDGDTIINIQSPVAWSAVRKPIANPKSKYVFDKWVDSDGNEIKSDRIFKEDFTAKACFKDAPEGEYGMKFTKQSLAGDTFFIVEWDKTDAINENLVIPSTHLNEADQKYYPVKWIRNFKNCSKIKTVKIPNSVTTIQGEAFAYDSSEGASSINSIVFEENSQLTTIEEKAFAGCGALTSIEIPNKVTEIKSNVFDMSGIEEPALNNVLFEKTSTLSTIQVDAFKNCKKITSINLPDSLTTLGGFNGTSIETIDIPKNVNTILERCFYNGDDETLGSLTTINFASDCSLTKISDSAFRNNKIANVSIPNSVTSIGAFAFRDCTSLTTVTINDDSKLKTLGTTGGKVFDNCPIISFTIPTSVEYIGSMIFGSSSTSKLESLTFKDIVNPWKLGISTENVFTPTDDAKNNATNFLIANNEYAMSKIKQ